MTKGNYEILFHQKEPLRALNVIEKLFSRRREALSKSYVGSITLIQWEGEIKRQIHFPSLNKALDES